MLVSSSFYTRLRVLRDLFGRGFLTPRFTWHVLLLLPLASPAFCQAVYVPTNGGTPGPQGIAGPAGTPGSPGAAGASGSQGLQGAPGAQGAPGTPGSQGVQGAPGSQGAAGTSGSQGAPGPSGSPGVAGTPGLQGIAGTPGAAGTPGITGAPGAAGTPGLGLVGLNALAPPTGYTACRGDGTTDDLPALQALADQAQLTGLPLLLPPGNYRLNGTLHLCKATLPSYPHASFRLAGLSKYGVDGDAPSHGVRLVEGLAGQKAVIEIDNAWDIGNQISDIAIDGGPGLGTVYSLWIRYTHFTQLAIDRVDTRNCDEGVATTGATSPNVGQGATATATVVNGGVTALTPVAAGAGYVPLAPASGGPGFAPEVLVTSSNGVGSGALYIAVVSPSGTVTGYTQVAPGTGYTAAPTVTVQDGGGGNGEEVHFTHCGLFGRKVMFENTSDAGQAYGNMLTGCFGGAGYAGQTTAPTLLLIGPGQGTSCVVTGGDFTLQPDTAHPASFLTTGGMETFSAAGTRIENCGQLVTFTGGGGNGKIHLDALEAPNSSGLLIAGDMGHSSIMISNCQIYSTANSAMTLTGFTGDYGKVVLDTDDFSFSNASALPIIGNAHFTLRDCRASPYGQYATPIADQKATF